MIYEVSYSVVSQILQVEADEVAPGIADEDQLNLRFEDAIWELGLDSRDTEFHGYREKGN
tara:strand:- start:2 stop:181 length:180 start_codon:yes stop_codon:yes gene_type:complete